jgi:hypothetical protein
VFVPEGPDDGSQAWNAWNVPSRSTVSAAADMIGWREGAIVSDSGPSVAPQITPFPTGRIISNHYQAFHAWLPSFRPSGTKVSFLMLTQMRGCGARSRSLFLRHLGS